VDNNDPDRPIGSAPLVPAGTRNERSSEPELTLHILGSRCGMPRDREPSSGYIVTADSTAVLLDCGPGVAATVSTVIEPAQLDAVFISHMHCDHCYDVLPIARAMIAPRVPYPDGSGDTALRPGPDRIPLFVPAGSRSVFESLQALFPVGTAPAMARAIDLAFDVREYRPGDRLSVGSVTVEPFAVRHAAVACGFRVETAHGTLAYTGDTGWSDDLIALARDCDLLLSEATLRAADPGPHGHLSAREAGRLAARTGARALVLTHFTRTDAEWLQALVDDARGEYDGPVLPARSGIHVTPTPTGRNTTGITPAAETDSELS
jgi:ribonuclease BN (tRNA processing enzyme)